MQLNELVKQTQSRIENLFNIYLVQQNYPSSLLQEAMRYGVLNGGKRIRPLLVYLTGIALDADLENLDPPACAIELIHSYSLIHDDLPAMDNADLRRGKPSCHKKYSEAIAILAGDALQPLAFEIIASHQCELNTEQRLKMISILSQESGVKGMASGQMIDLKGVETLEELTQMYQLKTGALLSAAVKLGMIAAKNEQLELQKFADYLGLAFQIQDDLLDVEGQTEFIGKPKGLDQTNQKTTYPLLVGVENSRKKVAELFEAALSCLDFLGNSTTGFHELAYQLLQRDK